ncbi:MAG: hypothetical protein ACJ77K_11735 [Bacteroidia bacterium]
MKSLLSFFLFLFSIILFSCSGPKPVSEENRVTPVEYNVIGKCNYLNKDNTSITITMVGNDLSFTFTFKKMDRLPFPVNGNYHDTLSKTAFYFQLRQNFDPLHSDYGLMQNTRTWSHDSSETATYIDFYSDTVDLKNETSISFGFPLYALHDLKKGKQRLELYFAQELFTDEVDPNPNDKNHEQVHLYEKQKLITGSIQFDIDIPAIYKTIVYGQGLVLRNDSTFSPAGMDVTLFQSSYPDIYWSIFYPVDNFYVQTPYERSTDRYEAHDTFNLYHYSINDSLEFAVYDHDNLSNDDGLGYWKGSLKELYHEKYNKILRFGPVAHFDLKVKTVGVVN